ncbi:MAG: hypothetical protein Q9168_003688 [Polycauliona sp. 1 TL-2023]
MKQVSKNHQHTIFHRSKQDSIRIPTDFDHNIAWYEASNNQWIAFDRSTGDIRDVQPFPAVQKQNQAIQATAPAWPTLPAPLPMDDSWPGWRADMGPFRSFLAMGMVPNDADPDIWWMQTGMYFRPCRISTGLEDHTVVPNLAVVPEGRPDMAIEECMADAAYHFPATSLEFTGSGSGAGESMSSSANARSLGYFSGAHHFRSGISHFGQVCDESDGMSSHFVLPSQPLRLNDSLAGCGPLHPATSPYRTAQLGTAPSPSSVSAPGTSNAGMGKDSQAIERQICETSKPGSSQPAPKKRQRRLEGSRQNNRPAAGTEASSFNFWPSQTSTPSNQSYPEGAQRTIPHPLSHTPDLPQSIATDSPTGLIRDEEGIRSVLPSAEARQRIIKDFDISAARLCFPQPLRRRTLTRD